MPDKENISPEERSIGRVNWYGGYNSKTDRDNDYGFLDSDEHGSVFVHKSGLICAPSDLKEGRWVTFRVEDNKKGKSAKDVDMAENESNASTISKLLNTRKIPIKIRVQACFHIPLEENHPLIPSMDRTINEYDHDYWFEKDVIDFPDSWKELDRESPLYKILPEKIRQARFNRLYPGIKQTINVLSNPVDLIYRNTKIYSSMSPQDRQLALSWVGTDSDFEKAKMLSARGAELITAEFFTEIGRPVIDIAIHQVTGESDQWKSHDLLIDSSCPMDVKNARSTTNSNVFVEYTIKRFKIDSQGRNVVIVGVLSPYLTLEKLEYESLLNKNSIQILGTTTQSQVRNLEQEFSKRELTIDFGDAQRWPIWIFNNDLCWFSNQRKAIEEFFKYADQVEPDDWDDCQQMVIPAFLIAGMDVPKYYREKLLPWQNWYLEMIVKKSKSGELTLPWLYLFTFHHFLEAINNIISAESKSYSPKGYNELLFFSEDFNETERPASLIDPMRVLEKLIETLDTLWDQRHSSNLKSLRNFVFRGEGLLTGIDPRGRKVTVLAYCGGFIEGQGKCGHSPLVIGQQETCHSCQMLICNKCGHCSNRCKNERNNNGVNFRI